MGKRENQEIREIREIDVIRRVSRKMKKGGVQAILVVCTARILVYNCLDAPYQPAGGLPDRYQLRRRLHLDYLKQSKQEELLSDPESMAQIRQQQINEQKLGSTDEPVIMATDEPAAGKPPCYLAWGRFLTEKEYHASGGKTAKEVTTMMATEPVAKEVTTG